MNVVIKFFVLKKGLRRFYKKQLMTFIYDNNELKKTVKFMAMNKRPYKINLKQISVERGKTVFEYLEWKHLEKCYSKTKIKAMRKNFEQKLPYFYKIRKIVLRLKDCHYEE